MSNKIKKPSIESDVRELLDRQALTQVLYNFCKGVDRFDYDMLNNCWWPDGTDDHGIFIGTGTEFCDWVFPFLQASMERTQHNILNTYIEIKGDKAHSECYFVIWHRMLPVIKMNMAEFIRSSNSAVNKDRRKGMWSRMKTNLRPRRLKLARTLFASHDMITAGRYIDDFERRDGEWRIKHRQVVYDWDKMDPVVDYYSEIFPRGERGHKDYSYSRRW